LSNAARIVVAEDDHDLLTLVGDALRKDGHDVVEATDGGRLLVLLAQSCKEAATHPDLIVSDVRMPVMTGLAMLKGLRDAHWTIPVILMTAFPDTDTRWRAESLDATIVTKPIRLKEIRGLVARRLAEARASVRALTLTPSASEK
jgi:DNA-binding response OmpR family regulator